MSAVQSVEARVEIHKKHGKHKETHATGGTSCSTCILRNTQFIYLIIIIILIILIKFTEYCLELNNKHVIERQLWTEHYTSHAGNVAAVV